MSREGGDRTSCGRSRSSRVPRAGARVGAHLARGDASALHRVGRGGRAALARGHGTGWLTAEYGMLPASTGERMRARHARPPGRAHGRDPAARRPLAARGDDLDTLGERTVWLDCDVLQADGGTRTRRDQRRLDRAARVPRDRTALRRCRSPIGRGRFRRHRRRRAAARPRLRGGFLRRGRHERRHDRRRAPHRGAGDRRAQRLRREQLDELIDLAAARDRADRCRAAGGGRMTDGQPMPGHRALGHRCCGSSLAALLDRRDRDGAGVRERAAGLRTHMLVGGRLGALHDRLRLRVGRFRLRPHRGWCSTRRGSLRRSSRASAFSGRAPSSARDCRCAASPPPPASGSSPPSEWRRAPGYYSAAVIVTGIVLVGLGPLRWAEGGALQRWREAGVCSR